MNIAPLMRDEVKAVIEGKSKASRIPYSIHFWTNPEVLGSEQQKIANLMKKYPEDFGKIRIKMPQIYDAPEDEPEYRWVNYLNPYKELTAAIDARIAISDWCLLDGILDNFPDPRYHGIFPDNPPDDGRYRLGYWFYCLFERLWSLRGMTNALMDFYTDPDSVHRLFRAVTDFYLVVMERAQNELKLDGILTSDDIGTQNGPFFSPEIFNEFFKPYYSELIKKAHDLGMHFWLHMCGNIEKFLPDFIEIGLDVVHPIQKYTMDEKTIVSKYGKDICVWAGFDVQRILPFGTPEDVRREVRFLIDTYFHNEGRFMLTAGNGITRDCSAENLEALLDEIYIYGTMKCAR